MNDLAQDRMAAARCALLFTSPEAGAHLTRLKLVPSPNVADVEIVGSKLFYNPTWVRSHPTICDVCPAVNERVAEVAEKYFATVLEVRRQLAEHAALQVAADEYEARRKEAMPD